MEKYYDIRIPDTGLEFERLTQIVCNRKFSTTFTVYGRNGQKQDGVDLYSNNFKICVQCKNYQGKNSTKKLLKEFEKDFIAANDKFGDSLTKYVLATTVQRDTNIQNRIETIARKYSKTIEILFWEDFQELLKTYPDILEAYHLQPISLCTDSEKRCTLSVKRIESHVSLDENSIEKLREICEDFQSHQRYPVQVELEIHDFKDISVLLLRNDIIQDYGAESAYFFADQSLRTNYFEKKRVLEIAIEHMLQDELLIYHSSLLRTRYIKKYGIEGCTYFDKNGIQRWYWTLFLWIDIIEELLKELVCSRYEEYADLNSLIPIDCWVENNCGETIWQFTSNISNNILGKMKPLMTMGGRFDYYDIKLEDRTKYLCPDLYYNIGKLKNDDRQCFDRITGQHKNVFCLLYYRFGYH